MAKDLFKEYGVRPPVDLFKKFGIQPNQEQLGPVEGFMVDMGRGFMDAGQGAGQLGMDIATSLGQRFPKAAGTAVNLMENLGMVDPGVSDRYNLLQAEGTAGNVIGLEAQDERQRVANEISEYEADRGALNPGRFTGNLLALAPVPGGVAGRAMTRLGTSALAGAGIGFAQPTQSSDPWTERTKNATVGAMGGAAGSAVVSGGVKAFNAMKGNFADKGAQEVVESANLMKKALSKPGNEAPEMPLSVGDVKGGAIIPKTETHLENVPVVGFSGIREKQNATAKDWAIRLIERIDDGSVDVGEELVKSAQTKLDYMKGVANKAFTEIGEEADKFGPVPLTNFQNVASKHAAQLKRLIDANPQLEVLFGKRMEKMSNFSKNTELLYSDLRLLRDDLSDMAEGLMPNSEVVGKRGSAAFMELKQSMEKDITDFMKEIGGGLEQKYLKAKSFYEKRIVPFKGSSKTGLNLLLKDKEPDRLLKKWVFGDKADKAKRLWMAMNHDGREAAKIGILRDAFEAGTHGQGAQHGVFSHAAFANTLDKYRHAIPQFFTKQEEQLVRGYQKVLRHTVRAGQYAENPSTGARNALPMIVGGGVVAGGVTNPAVTAQLAGGAYGLTLLFGSKQGRNLLLAASDLDVESKAMKGVINQIIRLTSKTSALGSVEAHEDHSHNLLIAR